MNRNVLYDERGYLEGPRFHAGDLYCANTLAGAVLRFDCAGKHSLVCQLRGVPCGLGFLPDGDLIILEMTGRKLWRWSSQGLSVYAELGSYATGTIDDMFIDASGRAYVGDLGFDLFAGPKPSLPVGRLLLVPPSGMPRVVAEGLDFPNGIAVNLAGDRLAVAESSGDSIAWFDVAQNGDLALSRRLHGFAEPDGICLGTDGKLWVAQFRGDSFVCVDDQGERHAELPTPGKRAVSCVLGGDDGRTLFCVSAKTTPEQLLRGEARSRLEAVRLD